MLKALGNRVVVIPEELPLKSASGLFLPESMKTVKQTASVVSVGPKTLGSVAVGDRIVFEDNAGTRVKQDGVNYVILDLSEVLGRESVL